MVGTTQQTVDRIERGQTAHSRYILPIRTFLNERLQLQFADDSLRAAAQRAKEEDARSAVPTYNLMPDGTIVPAEGVRTRIHFIDHVGDVYALHLTTSIKAPSGMTAVFRSGDTLIVDPSPVPRHYDWTFLRDPEDGSGKLVLMIDPAEVPSDFTEEEILEMGYGLLTRSLRQHHKIIARYIG